ncbi:type IV pilin [Methanomicrobium mobile]|uniref:type IV pilin n=1 Tax=Methanomicrobium mobile TaxID=2205 RepID=UPI0005B2BC55|nr:type IV pilin [Methanomicrobium mobile]
MVRKISFDEAVSPVVGVMLMIVVVVIVGASVSAFGMGMLSNTPSAPVAKIGYVGVMDGDIGEAGKIGLVFEHLGGDDIRLDDLVLNLKDTQITNITDSEGHVLGKTKGHEVTVAYRDLPSETIMEEGPDSNTAVLDSDQYMDYRFSKLPARKNGVGVISEDSSVVITAANLLISPGQKFIVLADKYGIEEGSRNGKVYYVAERGSAENPYSSGWFEVSAVTTYSIVHEPSGNVIASGTLTGSVI